MIPKHIITCIVALLFITKVHSFQENNSKIQLLSNEEISAFLVNTEEIRSTNLQDFSNNLIALESVREKFSTFHECYFSYLSSYKMTYIGKFDAAKNQLLNISNSCKNLNIQIKIKALLANLYALSGEYQKSILNLDFIVSQINNINDKKTKHIVYTVAFVVYEIFYQWELSLKFTELLIQEEPSEKYLCKAQVYKYIAILSLGRKDDFENVIPQIFKNCQLAGEHLYVQLLNINWLQYRFKTIKSENDVKELLNDLLNSNDEIENTKYKNLIGIKNSLFAQIYEKLDNPKLAVKYANITIENSVSIGTTEQKVDALQILINHHQNTLDHKTANQYLLEKSEAERKLYSDKQTKLMAYQTVKHDSLAKTHQITSLNQKNDLLSLENKLAEESKNSQRLINILLAILLMFFLLLIYRIRKQQKQYKRLSELDHMTLVYNRKGARDYMDYLLPYSENKNELIAYGIFDLDKFKMINDKYGHLTGDWVIKTVVSVCQKLDNAKVTFARLGGEEFSITIRDSSLEEIEQFSEQCRQAIYAIKTLAETGHDFQISASFGITTTESSGYDYLLLMKHADSALYSSKNNGRNQISVFES